jgi:hypothetical protein
VVENHRIAEATQRHAERFLGETEETEISFLLGRVCKIILCEAKGEQDGQEYLPSTK